MSKPSLIQRIRSRKIGQWAIAYLAGAFVAFQLLDALAEPLGLSTFSQRVILVAVIFGFFTTLVLAWYHGEKGRQRIGGTEIGLIALLLVIAGGVVSKLPGDDPASTSSPGVLIDPTRPSIAVLPCASMSPDPADDHLAEGLHDEILLRLQKISALASLGRTSVLRYSVDPPPLDEIASNLGVSHIGECSVRVEGDRLRLTFQLLDGKTGVHLLADNFDRDLSMAGLLDIQSEIAQDVAAAVGAEITPEEAQRIASAPTSDWDAFNHFIRGNVFFAQRTRSANQRAMLEYQSAIEIDPSFAAAEARIAMCFAQKIDYRWYDEGETRDLVLTKGMERAESAVGLAPGSGDAWVAIGYLRWISNPYEIPQYLTAFERAVALDPRNVEAHNRLAFALLGAGQNSVAVAEQRRSLAIDPGFHVAYHLFGRVAYQEGELDEAEGAFDTVLRMAPEYLYGLLQRGLVRARRQDLRGARSDAEALEQTGAVERSEPLHALLDALEGRTEDALARYQESGSLDTAAEWARMLVVLGEVEEALDLLTEAVVQPENLRDPFLNPLRSHPRFLALQERYEGAVWH